MFGPPVRGRHGADLPPPAQAVHCERKLFCEIAVNYLPEALSNPMNVDLSLSHSPAFSP